MITLFVTALERANPGKLHSIFHQANETEYRLRMSNVSVVQPPRPPEGTRLGAMGEPNETDPLHTLPHILHDFASAYPEADSGSRVQHVWFF